MSIGELIKEEVHADGFFRFQMRDVILVGSILLTTVTFVFTSMNRSARLGATVNELVVSVHELKETVKSENEKINLIDSKGTQFSIGSQRLQDEKMAQEDRRIVSMEVTLTQLVPDVREIKTKLDLVTNYLTEGKKR